MELTKEEYIHILQCKDEACFFCKNELNKFQSNITGNDKQQEQITKQGRKTKWTPEFDKKLLELRQKGESYEKIAEELNMSKPTVFHRYKKLEKEGNKPPKLNEFI